MTNPAHSPISLSQRLHKVAPWLMLLALLLVGGIGVIYLPGWMGAWPVEHVEVKGVTTVKRQQQVPATLGSLLAGQSFLRVSLSELRQKTLTLDWVEKVDVTRKWPDTLVLTIKERVPVAVWNDKRLISSEGVVFSAVDKYDTQRLPRLYGNRANLMDVMGYYHDISQALGTLETKVHELRVNARLTAYFTMESGLKLVVDRHDFVFKLKRFAKLYRTVLSHNEHQLKRVDLRYASGVAVKYGRLKTAS